MSICENKPAIEYPIFWEYRVIVDRDFDLKGRVEELLKGMKFKLNFSNISKNGNYKSYSLSVFVKSQDERLGLFSSLKKIVKFVL